MKRFVIPVIIICATIASAFSQEKIEVYVFVSEKCPISIYMANPLRSVVQKFDQNVDYFAVFPMRNSTMKTAKEFLESHELQDFSPIIDDDQSLATRMEATITPEVVVIQAGSIVYRGRISNAYSAPGKMRHGSRSNDLLDVLQQVQDGNSDGISHTKAIGCYITFHEN